MKLINYWVLLSLLIVLSCQSKSGKKISQSDSIKIGADSSFIKVDTIPNFAKQLNKDSTLYASIIKGLPIYIAPDTRSVLLGKAKFASKVKVEEVKTIPNPFIQITDYWCKISYKNKDGWVLGQYLTKREPSTDDFDEDIIGNWEFIDKDTIPNQKFHPFSGGYNILSDGTFEQDMPDGIKGMWSYGFQQPSAKSLYTLEIKFDTDRQSQDGGPSTHIKFKQNLKVQKMHFNYVEIIISELGRSGDGKDYLIKCNDTWLHKAIKNNDIQEVYLYLVNVAERFIEPTIKTIFELVCSASPNPNYEIIGALLKLPGASYHICFGLDKWYRENPNNPIIQNCIYRLNLHSQNNSDSCSYLMEAIRLKMDWLSRSLIDKGANVNLQDTLGNTALHYAIEFDRPEVAMYLLNRNAKVDIYNKKLERPEDLCHLHNDMQEVETRISKMMGRIN